MAGTSKRAGLGQEWDLPNLDHPRIDYWVARFDTVPEMRKKFQGFLDRGAELAPMILERLEARGMPQDLLYLAMIESGFQPNATSHAAAVGVWQFISATGQRYGLDIDRAVDERRDPVRATEAALDYLEDLHDRDQVAGKGGGYLLEDTGLEGMRRVKIDVLEIDGAQLSYQVPPRADGSIPISVWRRLD